MPTTVKNSICFILPHPVKGPTGGYKVVYDYANRLAAAGFDVHVAYGGTIHWKRKSLFHKLTAIIRIAEWRFRGFSGRRWYPLSPEVTEHLTWSLNGRHLPQADIYVATSPYTAWYLDHTRNELKREPDLFYFIQGLENWGPGLSAILEDTYHAPLKKIVIANWLHRLLAGEYGEESEVVPNGFDFTRFRCTVPPERRDAATVSMLWHNMESKECPLGLEALEIVRRMHPQLRVLMFGVPERPEVLPPWVEYYRLPTDEKHLWINNTASIYLGTSRQEGWGLTVGEAMACGQAVVCTANDGFLEMAVPDENALVIPCSDVMAMAEAVSRLISDPELRIRLARNGLDSIRSFDLETSAARFSKIITANHVTCGI